MKLFFIVQNSFASLQKGDNIQDLDTSWDQASLSASEVPEDNVLESLYKMRLRESV